MTPKLTHLLAAALMISTSGTALAQYQGQSEVLLASERSQQTGRAQSGEYNPQIPAVGLIRRADFAVRNVTIECDTRDGELREKELREMVENAVRAAPRQGLQLSFGSQTIETLDLDNYASLGVYGGGRPDTSRMTFLLKVPLTQGSTLAEVEKRMDDFVASVKPVGRAQFLPTGSRVSLSIVKPDQYRGSIIDRVSEDLLNIGGRIGSGYAVRINGLQRPVDWVRWEELDVLLFVPYELEVVPAG